MAFSNFSKRVITRAWGITELDFTSTAIVAGDLLASSGTLADKDTIAASLVALEGYMDKKQAGSTSTGISLKAAQSVEMTVMSTQPTGGMSTVAEHGGSVGDLLYLGDDGNAQTSAGTVDQVVGFCNSTFSVILGPTVQYYKDDRHIAGALKVASTFAAEADWDIQGELNINDKFTASGSNGNVASSGTWTNTGAMTLSGGLTASGTVTAASSKTVILSPTTYTADGTLLGKGYCKLNPGSTAALTMTLSAPACRDFLVISDQSTATASHVVNSSGCNIISTSEAANVKATFNAQHETLILFGVSSTAWALLNNVGSVALSTS